MFEVASLFLQRFSNILKKAQEKVPSRKFGINSFYDMIG